MIALDERQPVSGFTELSEGSKAAHGFDWKRDYAPTYRECPSAFWLAPDASDILPDADLVHPDLPVALPKADPPEQADDRVDNRAFGAAVAILAAGPIFMMTIPLVEGLNQPSLLFGFLAMLPVTIFVGSILSILPVCAGSFVLGKLGEEERGWRHPLAWMAVGAPFGMALAALFGSGPKGLVCMAVTGALCAGIARWKVRWSSGDQPPRNVRTPAVAISA